MPDEASSPQKRTKEYIRGVNLGGWLVLERYITPYTFAITDCHQRGDFCWYPGQIDAPPVDSPKYKLCHLNVTSSIDKIPEDLYGYDSKKNEIQTDKVLLYRNDDSDLTTKQFCEPVLSKNVFGSNDYPLDEWHLGQAFSDNPEAGAKWLNHHFENFLKKEDLVALKEAGITHLRVPLPHWILGDIHSAYEPWIQADRWKYFLRLCDWVREIGGLELWPNIHTAPGSQNGFDNSGIQNSVKTCGGWTDNPKSIQRSLDVLLEVSVALREANALDVVTGFGLLNEPFADCNSFRYKQFLRDGITIVRRILGNNISIYMSDLFQATLFNDGEFGHNPEIFNNTFLDSHYYNIFSPAVRKMSPQEHIKHICHPEEGEDVKDCCYEDPPQNTTPLKDGTKRIVAEWTGAFDAMPGEILKPIMKGIHDHGVAPLMDRELTEERKSFLTKFIQAQIVSFEAADMGSLSYGWFYWNFKMEGGAYIEWDFLRGVQEGWFPMIAPASATSESIYGSCSEILGVTNESVEIVHPYPWGDPAYWRGSLVNDTDTIGPEPRGGHKPRVGFTFRHISSTEKQIFAIALVVALVFGWKRYRQNHRRKSQYIEILT